MTKTIDEKIRVLMLESNAKTDGSVRAALGVQGYEVERVKSEFDLLLKLRDEVPERPYVVVLDAKDPKNVDIVNRADEDIRLGQHYIMMVGYAQSSIDAEKNIARKKMQRRELPGAKKMHVSYRAAAEWISKGRLDVHYKNYEEFLAGREQLLKDTGEHEKVDMRQITIENMPLEALEDELPEAEYNAEKARRDTSKTEKGRYSRFLRAGQIVETEHKAVVPDYAMPGAVEPDELVPASAGMMRIDGKSYLPEPSAVALKEDYSKAPEDVALKVRILRTS